MGRILGRMEAWSPWKYLGPGRLLAALDLSRGAPAAGGRGDAQGIELFALELAEREVLATAAGVGIAAAAHGAAVLVAEGVRTLPAVGTCGACGLASARDPRAL